MLWKWGLSTAIKERKNSTRMVRGNKTHILHTTPPHLCLESQGSCLRPTSKGTAAKAEAVWLRSET